MTPERWLRISQIVADAIELPAAQRAEFVSRACGSDQDLRREVERLLQNHDEAQDFLETLSVSAHDIVHAPGPGAPHLNPGDLVSGRYRIIRFIQRGGMGEVYQAEDVQAGGTVALKTIRPEIASDERVLSRFKREVFLSKKVTHPNVCRVYDLHWHRPGQHSSGIPGPKHEFLFLTMQYLPGETLAEYLRSKGALKPDAALPLIREMAQALDAAHAVRVIHRDFKSGNVMLVPAGEAGNGTRAVVTDFGLARSASLNRDASLTASEAVVGTPDYMAPEQFDKGEVSVASDVYALGVVVYEMITGRKPFSGAKVHKRRRAHELPPSPKTYVPDLPPHWERAILRALAASPGDRFATAQDFVAALETPPKQSRWASGLRWAATVLGIAATAGLALLIAHVIKKPRGGSRPSIAVVGFASTANEHAAGDLSPALSAGLSAALRWGEELAVIPQESITRLKQDLGLTNQDAFSPETLQRIRANVQAEFVVTGSYIETRASDKVILYVNLQQTNGREIAASFQLEGTQTSLDDLTYRAGVRVRRELRTGSLSTNAREFVRASLPSNMTALRLYSQGMEDLRIFQYAKARADLEQAVAADPDFAPAHSLLAEVWNKLDNERKAGEEAERAYRLASNLSREEDLLIAARYWEMSRHDWKQAAEAYRKLMDGYPNKVYYGIHLAQVQDSKDALATLARLRRLTSPPNDDPAIDVEEASNRESLGNYRTAQQLAAEGARKAAERGARHLEADARFNECYASMELGEFDRARSAYDSMNAIYEALGDPSGVVQAKRCLALILVKEGEFEAAMRILDDAVAICREMQSEGCVMRVQRRIANAMTDLGRLTDSLRLAQPVLAYYREQRSDEMIATEVLNIGNVFFLQGHVSEARQSYESALKTFRALDSPKDIAFPLLSLADLFIETGDLSSAQKDAEEALAIGQSTGNPDHIAESEDNLARIAIEREDLDRARSLYEKTLSTRIKIGEKANACYSLMGLAIVELKHGAPEKAVSLAQRAADEFRREHRRDELGFAEAVLAKALLRQGKTAQACRELAALRPLLSGQEDRVAHISTLVEAAPVQAACGAPGLAVRNLNDALREATEDGLVRLELEAEAELGEQELKSGSASAGRRRLEKACAQATKRGYLRIANRCSKPS